MKNRFRRLTDPARALEMLLARAGPLGSAGNELVAVEHSVGRVTAEPVRAFYSSPPYHSAAMDGIAVASAKTAGASATTPLFLVEGQDAKPIDTGDRLPPEADAVIPIEQLDHRPDGTFQILAAATPRQHVRLTGEDMVAGEILLPRGRRITPAHVGALLGAGVIRIAVRALPRVAMLPTGDELCEPGENPCAGKVIESNSRMLSAYIRRWGGEPVRLSPVPDQPTAVTAALEQALRIADVVLILAGSSAGRGDFTPDVIGRLGELLFQGVSLMPGKPTAAGVALGKIVVGVPGFPVSAAVAADRFVRPLLAHLLGVTPEVPEQLRARLQRAIPSRPGIEEVIRVVTARVGESWVTAPLPRGAGAISSLSRAHALLHVPAASEGIAAGTVVELSLLLGRAELERGLLFAGSHDLALSILEDHLAALLPGTSLSVLPLGSLGGLSALARGEAHLAGCHLLDPETGTYNLPAVARFLPERELLLVTLAHRSQGLCLRHDETREPKSLSEAAARGMRFVNRQPGSGTRVLTDALLRQSGISPERLRGYDHEEFTHLAVAEAVRSGAADCGMAIRAAAEAMRLRFVPLAEERYDLVIPREHLTDPRIGLLRQVLSEPKFKNEVEQLGGYDTRETGRALAFPPGTWIQ